MIKVAKQTKKQNNKLLIGGIIFLAVIAILYFVLKSSNITPQANVSTPPSAQQTKIFTSKALKFSIQVPPEFQIEEKFTIVIIKAPGGEITIDRIGTNYDNLGSYIEDLENKNKLVIERNRKLKINQLDSIEGVIKHPVSGALSEKAYFIYIPSWTVFTLSTSSVSLFPVLDQVAQSFRYTP